jgi:hypothetical protein
MKWFEPDSLDLLLSTDPDDPEEGGAFFTRTYVDDSYPYVQAYYKFAFSNAFLDQLPSQLLQESSHEE